jgi:nucleoside-diphosphate-sugar epimerase
MNALIIGCGYLGRRVASRWTAASHQVSALTRSVGNAAALQSAGITPYLGDVLNPDSLRTLPAADVLLFAVGRDRSAEAGQRELYVDGLANVVRALAGRIQSLVYISSTSVYGQSDGSWIDELSPCQPMIEGGRIVLDAEEIIRRTRAPRTAILRLAGLYGPGRLIARINRLHRNEPIAGDPDAWLNLIHVEDAAACVAAVGECSQAPPLLLVSDDRPVTRREFYSYIATLVGAPDPRFDSALTPARTSGLNKRCRNSRLHEFLRTELRYPDFRAGLPAALHQQR